MRTAALVLIGSLVAAPGIADESALVPGISAEVLATANAAELPPAPSACPNVDPLAAPLPSPADPSLIKRLLKYSELHFKHRVTGLASYYSSFFHGRKTANGEIFRNNRYSAAHLTLPLGTWVEVKSRATGKKLRLRVNDRGPYVKKFAIDLSQAAARYLGVDKAKDRFVEFRVIALPGEEPLPEDIDWNVLDRARANATSSATVTAAVTPGS